MSQATTDILTPAPPLDATWASIAPSNTAQIHVAESTPPVVVVLDAEIGRGIIEDREAKGVNQHDEVWDGVYIIMPIANNEHQDITGGLTGVFYLAIAMTGLGRICPGVNVSDREEDWTDNYRCPDVAVFLNDSAAKNRGAYWLGGPDFAVEIVSRGDRSRDKIDFHAKVGARELLLLDRAPWALELHQLRDGCLVLAGVSTPAEPQPVSSSILPLSFRLVPTEPRPWLEIRHHDGVQVWRV